MKQKTNETKLNPLSSNNSGASNNLYKRSYIASEVLLSLRITPEKIETTKQIKQTYAISKYDVNSRRFHRKTTRQPPI